MAAAAGRQHASLTMVTLLALLVPMACHADDYYKPLCAFGWERPTVEEVLVLGRLVAKLVCPDGSEPTPFCPASSGYTISETGLSVFYYSLSCPRAEDIVYGVVKAAVDEDPGRGAGLIRLFFHDCFVEGCDGSVLIETTATGPPTEMEGIPNKNSLRESAFKVIEEAKTKLEAECPGVVSCADVVAFAARDASKLLSYDNRTISFAMPAGRLDGRVSLANATGTLPGPFSDLNTLEAMFKDQGLSAPEMVTLSGAHSVGRAHCQFISTDGSHTNQTFANGLRSTTCKTSRPTGTVDQDHQTPYVLDNKYYDDVRTLTALFDSDAALLNSTDTKSQVYADADSRTGKWEADFARAMVKMGYIRIKTTKPQGEIRKVCSRVNGS